MKTCALVLLGSLLVIACSSTTSPAKDFEKINWLAGQWNRIHVKEGQSAHENWEFISAHELKGVGVSIRGNDTTFVEALRIVAKDGSLFYVADVSENPKPVYFKFTSLNEHSFICENKAHDFPKKIEYQLQGDSLKVVTSGGGEELTFEFLKIRK